MTTATPTLPFARNAAKVRGAPLMHRLWFKALLMAAWLAGVILAGRLIEGTSVGAQVRYLLPILPLTSEMLPVPFTAWQGVLLTFTLGVMVAVLGIGLLKLLFRPGYGPLPVARLAVTEALTTRGLVFLVLAWLLLLAVIPALQSSGIPLRYRIQSTIRWGMFSSDVLLGLVTIVFTCYSVTEELRLQRAFTVFSKPVHRISYLAGKFMAVVGMTAVLTLSSMLMIHAASVKWLGTDYATDAYDLEAIANEVLVSRWQVGPRPPFDLDALAREEFEQLLEREPQIVQQRGAAEVLNEIRGRQMAAWHSLGPGNEQTYIFTNLHDAPRDQMLRLQFEITGFNLTDGTPHILVMTINGQQFYVESEIGRVQVQMLDPRFIAPNGTLTLSLLSPLEPVDGSAPFPYTQDTLQLSEENGIRILWKAGDFMPNLAAAATFQWVRTVFLTALALVASSFCAFSVASLMSLSIWVLALFAGGLGAALSENAPGGVPGLTQVFDLAIVPVMTMLVNALSAFSAYDAAGRVIDGLVVPEGELWKFIRWIGLGWTGVAGLLAWYIFSRRELAKEMS